MARPSATARTLQYRQHRGLRPLARPAGGERVVRVAEWITGAAGEAEAVTSASACAPRLSNSRSKSGQRLASTSRTVSFGTQ